MPQLLYPEGVDVSLPLGRRLGGSRASLYMFDEERIPCLSQELKCRSSSPWLSHCTDCATLPVIVQQNYN